jgi:plasmid stabilization system protein ParE
MAKTVKWSDSAGEDFYEIVNYLMDNWSFEVADKFTDDVEEILNQITEQPFSGPRIMRVRSLRKIPLKPHYSLLYSILDDIIYIMNIVDNRQKPEYI